MTICLRSSISKRHQMKKIRKKSKKTLLFLTTNQLVTRSSLQPSPVRGKEERSFCALTLIDSTTLKTCATTATTVKERAKWHQHADILTDLTTQEACARTVTYPSTTSKEKIRRQRRTLTRRLRLRSRPVSRKRHRSTKLPRKKPPSLTQKRRSEDPLYKVSNQPRHPYKVEDFKISNKHGEAAPSFQMGPAHHDLYKFIPFKFISKRLLR